MTEKEKMLAGELYFAPNEEVDEEHKYYYDLCHEFNHTRPSDREKLDAILKKILGKYGKDPMAFGPIEIDLGYNVEVGDNFFMNHQTVILATNKVKFGDNCLVAPCCTFSTAGHPFNVEERNAALEYAYPITVGDNVWIGMGTRVCPGVTIGSNVVIGAGSVVCHDIPDNVIAVGNPCEVVREMTEKDYDRYHECEYDFAAGHMKKELRKQKAEDNEDR